MNFNTTRFSLISLFLICIILMLLDLYETDGYYKEPKHSYHHDGSKWGKHHGSHHGHKHHDAHDKGHHGHSHGHHNKGHKDHGWKKWHFKKGYKHGYHAYGNQYGAGSKDYGHANKHYGSHHKDHGDKHWGKKHGGHHGYHDGHHKGHDAHWWKGGEHKRSIKDLQTNTIFGIESKQILHPKNFDQTNAPNFTTKTNLYSGSKFDSANITNYRNISNLPKIWPLFNKTRKNINNFTNHVIGLLLLRSKHLGISNNTRIMSTANNFSIPTAAQMDYQKLKENDDILNERQKSPESSYDEDELDDDFNEDQEDEKEYSDIQGDVEDMPEPDYAHMSQI